MSYKTISRETLSKVFKNKDISLGVDPLVCAPILDFSTDTKNILTERRAELNLVEIRSDFLLSGGFDPEECMGFLKQLGIPFLFTMRSHLEGGQVKLSSEERLNYVERAFSFDPACVDIELSTITENKVRSEELIEKAHSLNICVIASYHDFNGTPEQETLKRIAGEEAKTGADMLKIATYIRESADILSLLEATYSIRKSFGKPLAIMGMGNLGRITRVASVSLGSDLVYADLVGSSASGQVPYQQMREMIQYLYY